MKSRWKVLLISALAITFVVASVFAVGAQENVREETVVYTGVSWAPPNNWNPLYHNPQAGTVGLMYEPLFHFNPHSGEWTPWLAKEEGEWIEDDVFAVKLREEPTFHDGEPITAEDVKFTFDIANEVSLYYSPIWNYLDEVVAVSETEVEFRFDRPNYQQFETYLYNQPIVPKHIFENVPKDELANFSNKDGVGSGPFTIGEALEDRMIWERVDNWWGNDIHGKPAPRFIEDVLVYGNNIALGMLLQGELDVSNNFLPGTPGIVNNPGYSVSTYYDEAPYHLSGNTGLLYLNTTKPELSDRRVRRAIAFALDTEEIIQRTYKGAARQTDSSGLFGAWAEYKSEEAIEEYGFEYNPTHAKALLDDAGYVDADNDGWREMPNGDDILLQLQVPAGWSDWENIMNVVGEHLAEIGINTEPNFTDQTVYNNAIWNADFDIVFNDYQTQISSTPYTYFQAVATDDIDGEQATNGNFGRYDNEKVFDLITEFNMTPPETEESMEIAAEIQKILMRDMPAIPIMLDPIYSQNLETHWTNWPSKNNPTGVAVGWAGLWQMGGLEAILNLEPAE